MDLITADLITADLAVDLTANLKASSFFFLCFTVLPPHCSAVQYKTCVRKILVKKEDSQQYRGEESYVTRDKDVFHLYQSLMLDLNFNRKDSAGTS